MDLSILDELQPIAEELQRQHQQNANFVR